MLLLMFRHGLRVSELCSIKLPDINLETREFHVNRLKGCNGGPHELYNGESPALRAWLAERAKMDHRSLAMRSLSVNGANRYPV